MFMCALWHQADDDDVGLHVLGCWVDILETNCNGARLLLQSY